MALVNRVANSGLETIDIQKYYPTHDIVELDIKVFLFQELLLREKEFRQLTSEYDWSQYQDKIVCITNDNDAIAPKWAFMLLTRHLAAIAHDIWVGTKQEFLKYHYSSTIRDLDLNSFSEKRVILKGCSDVEVNAQAYALLTKRLLPLAQSIMYGEACSSVPIFKRPRKV